MEIGREAGRGRKGGLMTPRNPMHRERVSAPGRRREEGERDPREPLPAAGDAIDDERPEIDLEACDPVTIPSQAQPERVPVRPELELGVRARGACGEAAEEEFDHLELPQALACRSRMHLRCRRRVIVKGGIEGNRHRTVRTVARKAQRQAGHLGVGERRARPGGGDAKVHPHAASRSQSGTRTARSAVSARTTVARATPRAGSA